MRDFAMFQNGRAAAICLDEKGNDYAGLKRVGKALQNDVGLVTGVKPQLLDVTENPKGSVVVAGTLGENAWIDSLIREGKLSVGDLAGKRECFVRTLLDAPMEGVEQALVIVGSEKLGTIYGMFSLSEWMGVSPWAYWGDVTPKTRTELALGKEEAEFVSKEPSVRYRGFFMNDEWPSLGNWTEHAFGGFNDLFYDKVFELLLRLKGNFLWPAMWSASFSIDGKETELANAVLAQEYGITMGTSHHEPLMRASEEWDKVKSESNDEGYGKDWNYHTNKRGLYQYWTDSVVRNKPFANLITMGMRGERDSTILGDFSGLQENVDLLKEIILDQKKILKDNGLEDAPKVLALYKEVEDYYYGDETVEGLDKWKELDDVMFLLSDDNFGNCRTLPTPENCDRKAGWGIYYHFDYHGGPISYEWVNSTPLAKVWEQMTMAYDYGVRDLWVVNVGDLRPQELPLSFFLDMAYDFEALGTSNINGTKAYTRDWAKEQFGAWVGDEVVEGIAGVLDDYTRMNGNRRPEATSSQTFSPLHHRELMDEFWKAQAIQERAIQLEESIPEAMAAAYYGLVYYPAVASANVRKMNLFAALSQLYGKRGSVLANHYGDMVEECISIDEDLTLAYNEKMANGKWKGMMSSAHIGFTKWNDEDWAYPETVSVEPKEGAYMLVDVEGVEEAFAEGRVELPAFDGLGEESRRITVSNGGDEEFAYSASSDSDWIVLSKKEGTVEYGDVFEASVDWSAQPSGQGLVTIEGNGQKVEVVVRALRTKVDGLEPMTFVESGGYVCIEAEHYREAKPASGVEWKRIEDYGRTLSSMKMYPTTVDFASPKESPYMEYGIFLQEGGEYALTAYFAPSNNLRKEWGLEYALSFDGGEPVVVDALPDDFAAGNHYYWEWCKNVLNNSLLSTTKHSLEKGFHTLRFHGVNAGLVLQRLVIHKGELPPSYYGPKESFYV